MNGWIKLHRKIWQNPVVTKDSDHLAVWIYLLTHATHQEHDTLWKGQRITLKPGQLITGRKKLSKELHICDSKVNRILQVLKIEHQIEQQTSSQGSLISILAWDKYQKSEQPNEQRVNSERTASEQRVNTIQEYKEYKKQKNDQEFHYETNADKAGMSLKDFIKAKAKGEIG